MLTYCAHFHIILSHSMAVSFQWLCILYVTFGSVFYGYDSGQCLT